MTAEEEAESPEMEAVEMEVRAAVAFVKAVTNWAQRPHQLCKRKRVRKGRRGDDFEKGNERGEGSCEGELSV
jgi:hypothetical protein